MVVQKIKELDAQAPWSSPSHGSIFYSELRKLATLIDSRILKITESISSSVLDENKLNSLLSKKANPRNSIEERMLSDRVKQSLPSAKSKFSNKNTNHSSKVSNSSPKDNVLSEISDFNSQYSSHIKKIVLSKFFK